MMTCTTCAFTGSWHKSLLLYWTAGTAWTAVLPIWGRLRFSRQNMASFSCKCKGVLQVDGGRGGGGVQWYFFVSPSTNLECCQGWKQNSMGARAAKLGSFNRSTFTQTKDPRVFQTPQSHLHPLVPLPPYSWGRRESIYGQDLQPPRIQALEKLVALLTERCLEQWGESLGALGALWPAPSEYKRRWWQHVAGIREFHCGLKSFQQL